MAIVPRFAGETEPGLRTAPACINSRSVFAADRCPSFKGRSIARQYIRPCLGRIGEIMNSTEMGRDNRGAQQLPGSFPVGGVIVIGAGHFGKRALHILGSRQESPVWVVERDEGALAGIADSGVERVLGDGVAFLAARSDSLPLSTIIVPALPVHFAFEWLRAALGSSRRHRPLRVPEAIKELVPYAWDGRDGSLLVSYADFRCPDDCPEPAGHCTVTGKRREKPMYEVLGGIAAPGFHVHVLRSRQLAPGLGGYSIGDMKGLLGRVESAGDSKWLVGTACKCHGVISGLEVTL